MVESRLQERVVPALSGLVGAVALPALCFAGRNLGPAARVVFYDYLPLDALGMYGLAVLVGAAIGWVLPGWLSGQTEDSRRGLFAFIRSAGFAALAVWVAWPQLNAFPASASAAEREAWAREHVTHYAALVRVINDIPRVTRDVGEIQSVAPTDSDQHSWARTMNGDDMRFTLEIIGKGGTGTFHVDCTLDDSAMYEWRSGRWVFLTHDTRISSVPRVVPP